MKRAIRISQYAVVVGGAGLLGVMMLPIAFLLGEWIGCRILGRC